MSSGKAMSTPGPWFNRRGTSGFEVWGNVGSTGSMRIASCGHAATFDQANAQLIAAAPDLLAAAVAQEDAEDFYANRCPDADDHGEDMPELCEHCFPYFDKARCMRRAAIAKAKGEAA